MGREGEVGEMSVKATGDERKICKDVIFAERRRKHEVPPRRGGARKEYTTIGMKKDRH